MIGRALQTIRSVIADIRHIRRRTDELLSIVSRQTEAKMRAPADEPTKLLERAYFKHEPPTGPYAFASTVCRADAFLMPLYAYWACMLKEEPPRLHRKQWEFVYICQVLSERGYLRPGSRGIGFGVGKEPLADLFCSYGCEVIGTDLAAEEAAGKGWAETDQHAANLESLYRGISAREDFERNVTFRPVNMNSIPADLRGFDFCYSSCSIEHVGSLDLSKAFLRNVLDVLKPGGLSVHTTEFNITSNSNTVTDGPTILWRRRDFESLAERLRDEGHFVEPLDFYFGDGAVDRFIDVPPYSLDEPHLRLQLGQYASTSMGFVVRKAG